MPSLDEVIITADLARRPTRPPNYWTMVAPLLAKPFRDEQLIRAVRAVLVEG